MIFCSANYWSLCAVIADLVDDQGRCLGLIDTHFFWRADILKQIGPDLGDEEKAREQEAGEEHSREREESQDVGQDEEQGG